MTAEATTDGVKQGRRRAADPLSSRSLRLWLGVLGPPLFWAAHLVLGDLIFELGCSAGMRRPAIFGLSLRSWAVVQTALFLGLTALAGLGAHFAWRTVRGRDDGTRLKRTQALAIAGMASAAIYGLLIAFAFVAQAILHQCTTSL